MKSTLPQITFNKTPTFGEKPKAFKFDTSKWQQYSWDELLELKLKDLWALKFRFLLELKFACSGLHKEFTVRLCTHDEDVMRVADKYPDDYTINLLSILRIFKTNLVEQDNETFGRILFAVSELGAEVVK